MQKIYNTKLKMLSSLVGLVILIAAGNYIFTKINSIENKKLASSSAKEFYKNNYLVNTNNNDFEDFKTKYSDGRISSVRNFRYYNSLIKSSVPFGDTFAAKKLGLTTIVTEWNSYDGNVASPEAAFIEIPVLTGSAQQKEWAATGIDAKSTMIGGDVESNRRIKEPSIRYWAVASKMFEQEFKNLKKAEGISNRNIDSVTFDFITTYGFYTVQIPKTELESGQSVWSEIFKESKFLNDEMARIQNESQKDAEKRFEARETVKIRKNN